MATMLTNEELEAQPRPTQARTVNLMVDVSDTALQRVRAGFNPDRITEVGHLHLLAAVFITACEKLRDRAKPMLPQDGLPEDVPASTVWAALDEGARQAAIAITNIETASMYAVKAATAVPYASKNMVRQKA
jgi:hypothetical protein